MKNLGVILALGVLFTCSSAEAADCLNQQLACNQRCILHSAQDYNCIPRCGEEAFACIERENGRRNSQNSYGDSRSEYESGGNDDSDSGNYERPAGRKQPVRSSSISNRPSGNSGSQRADKYDRRPSPTNCVKSFYDPNYYNWLAYQNVCSEAIHINYICRSCGERMGSAMELAPGRKQSTGLSGPEVKKKGGIAYAVCREGYHAVNPNGDWWQPNQQYMCRKL